MSIQLPSPGAPYAVAKELIKNYERDGHLVLRAWRGGWIVWRTTHWAEIDTAELRGQIYAHTADAVYEHKKDGTSDWNPDRYKVANVMEALAAVAYLTDSIDSPAWLTQPDGLPSADTVISCRNGLLPLNTRELASHTPTLFNTVSVPFDYDADATAPAWARFLQTVWPDDEQSIQLVQEYFGYILSGATEQQKALLIVGPSRSGKGTIARTLTALVGRGHVAGPTLSSLGQNFGLAPLLGKPLAIISDARMGNSPGHIIVERLLSVTGEDTLTVDRKFREPWTGKLPTRFLILSNEVPRFRDSSAAIAGRLMILQMTMSFLGKEDRTLDRRLQRELPGILNWSLEGLDRLVKRGRFTEPKSSRDACTLMLDLASPVSAFVRDRCNVDPKEWVSRDDLYDAWKVWAEENGHHPGATSSFGRDLHAAVPSIRPAQRTIADRRIRVHTGISVKPADAPTHKGADDPVHPVQPSEFAGQDGHEWEPTSCADRVQSCAATCADDPAHDPCTRSAQGDAQDKSAQSCRSDSTAQDAHDKSVPTRRGEQFRLPAGPGRCPDCGFHYPTQGHRGDCPQMPFRSAKDICDALREIPPERRARIVLLPAKYTDAEEITGS